jgi:hypothetical protein
VRGVVHTVPEPEALTPPRRIDSHRTRPWSTSTTAGLSTAAAGRLAAPADRRPTAGCVSLNPADLVTVLRWLRPGTRIAVGPSGWLLR